MISRVMNIYAHTKQLHTNTYSHAHLPITATTKTITTTTGACCRCRPEPRTSRRCRVLCTIAAPFLPTPVRMHVCHRAPLCAMPRMIVALLENHQRADGTVSVPAALRPLLGLDVLELP